jgi:DNA modification methylase
MLKINNVYQGNSLELLKELDDNSIDSIVTDPPYELGFMGKSWDKTGIAYNVELWKECLRVLKHGGHLLAFGGTRTYHRMACAIEDAGFEIRDQIQWIYGSGFPKSQDVSRVIDKKKGEVRGKYEDAVTELAKKWEGYGTALKPANEPIVLARKPLEGKTIVENLEKWETGVLNIDDCRIEYDPNDTNVATNPALRKTINGGNGGKVIATETERRVVIPNSIGRFPANVIMDEETAVILDEQSGERPSGKGNGNAKVGETSNGSVPPMRRGNLISRNDTGGASRFFYCAKAHKSEKGEFNNHPTVKPVKLMEYLVRLVTPENGIVLDPFSGSGSTIIASINTQKNYIGFELNQEYVDIINKRIHNNK